MQIFFQHAFIYPPLKDFSLQLWKNPTGYGIITVYNMQMEIRHERNTSSISAGPPCLPYGAADRAQVVTTAVAAVFSYKPGPQGAAAGF